VTPQSGLGGVTMSAREVADAGIAGMLGGKRLVVPGVGAKLMGVGGRFTPRGILLPALRRAAARRG
jgi:short-subunit dehydrogenase